MYLKSYYFYLGLSSHKDPVSFYICLLGLYKFHLSLEKLNTNEEINSLWISYLFFFKGRQKIDIEITNKKLNEFFFWFISVPLFVTFQFLYTFHNAQFYSCTLYCSPCFNYRQNHKTEDKGSHNILSVQIKDHAFRKDSSLHLQDDPGTQKHDEYIKNISHILPAIKRLFELNIIIALLSTCWNI